MSDVVVLRSPEVGELTRLQEVEAAAGASFATVGRPEVAADPPLALEALAAWRDAGRCWVAADDDGPPLAYVVVDLLDGAAHIEQVSVHPTAAGRRLGAALVDHVGGWAHGLGLPWITLTTFRDVPWNGPYYRRLGFTPVPAHEVGPELAARLAEEAAHGLLPADREALRRPTRPAADGRALVPPDHDTPATRG